MKKLLVHIKDTFIAGLVFLLPLLVLVILAAKVFVFFNASATKLAEIFGLASIAGAYASLVAAVIAFSLLCMLCGLLIRQVFLKHISTWVDDILCRVFPVYRMYHQMTIEKFSKRHEDLPYHSAAWIKTEQGIMRPAFIVETMPDGKLVMFIPTAGNVEEGTLLLVNKELVQTCNADIKSFNAALANQGRGLSETITGEKSQDTKEINQTTKNIERN